MEHFPLQFFAVSQLYKGSYVFTLGFYLQDKKENNTPIKRMADLLIQGATLTDLSCPVCASPLFRLKDGTLWCAKDEKKVVIVKEGEEPPKPSAKQHTTNWNRP